MSDNLSNQSITKEHQAYLRSKKIYKARVLFAQVFLLIAFLTLWEMAANFRWIDPFITSQPSRVVRTLLSLHGEEMLYYHIGVTVFETVVGFVLGTIIGTAISIVLWWSDFISKVLDPYLVILNSLPKIALGPILIVWASVPTIVSALKINVGLSWVGVIVG